MLMYWAIATAGAAVAGAVVDWMFSGARWIHSYYNAYPEVWRDEITQNETKKAVIGTQLLVIMSAAAFVALALKLGQVDPRGAAKLALMIWLIGPVPALVTRALFMKVHKIVTVAHLAGALVKLELAAVAVVIVARMAV